ncbi:AI-2E family transporter [Kaistella daneshvariae]|uniref:AI-2E family transporter n=1 Tax=Kaistella daneshvariae TaxID=2487074 RepID=A0ABM7CA08_9FLAO|nr:AI-2E family transporter [Kaistella daneshvariae]AZI67829.1 AI-2E family transporter [Kaistella daneshvariae]
MEQNSPASNNLNFKNKVWLTAGILLLLLVVAYLFSTLLNLLLLVLAGALVSIYFHACAGLLTAKLKIGSPYALIISVLLNLIIVGLFFWFVGARLNSQVDELSQKLPQTIDNAKSWLSERPLGEKILNYSTNSLESGKATSTIKAFFSSTFGILSDVYIVILLAMFFIASPETYRRGVIHLVPTKGKKTAENLYDEIHRVLKNWIKGEIFGFVFIAVLTGLGLWILGMPQVLTLALIAGLLNFIPNFGPLIALVPAVLLGLMQGPNTALLVLGLYTFIQIVQSTVTQPLIQKKMVSVPPALLIFGQVGMGLIAGFWGVLLATPVIAIIMTLVNKLYVEKQEGENENNAA